jgi:hypothetical protein
MVAGALRPGWQSERPQRDRGRKQESAAAHDGAPTDQRARFPRG